MADSSKQNSYKQGLHLAALAHFIFLSTNFNLSVPPKSWLFKDRCMFILVIPSLKVQDEAMVASILNIKFYGELKTCSLNYKQISTEFVSLHFPNGVRLSVILLLFTVL